MNFIKQLTEERLFSPFVNYFVCRCCCSFLCPLSHIRWILITGIVDRFQLSYSININFHSRTSTILVDITTRKLFACNPIFNAEKNSIETTMASSMINAHVILCVYMAFDIPITNIELINYVLKRKMRRIDSPWSVMRRSHRVVNIPISQSNRNWNWICQFWHPFTCIPSLWAILSIN